MDPRKEFRSQRPETHEEWQARMGGEVLAVVRSGLYLDFRFLDMALSALTPAPDERCRVLATDGQMLYYQPARLLQLYQQNPKYLNRLYLHVVFHCVFRHLWLKGRREPQLWSLACDIAVENVIDSLNRASVKRPLTYVRQNAYQQITAEEKVVAAAPAYRWLTRQTPGVLRQRGVAVTRCNPARQPQAFAAQRPLLVFAVGLLHCQRMGDQRRGQRLHGLQQALLAHQPYRTSADQHQGANACRRGGLAGRDIVQAFDLRGHALRAQVAQHLRAGALRGQLKPRLPGAGAQATGRRQRKGCSSTRFACTPVHCSGR